MVEDGVRRRRRGRSRRASQRYLGLRALSQPRQALVIVVGLVGVLLCLYLTYDYFFHLTLPCFVGRGCDVVLDSRYATVFGFPLALAGVIAYLAIVVTAYGWVFPKYGGLLLYVLSLAALTASCFLAYQEAVVLVVSCSYCELSHGLNTAIFVVLLVPVPILGGLPFRRHKLLSLAVIATVLGLAILAHAGG